MKECVYVRFEVQREEANVKGVAQRPAKCEEEGRKQQKCEYL